MQDQDHELEQDHNEEAGDVAAQNQEVENSALDPQTLENLAAFLTRDNSEPREEHESDEDKNKFEANEQHNEAPAHRANSPSAGDRQSKSRSRSRERNNQRWLYCCGKCKKNDKKGKTCVCVVPADQRRVSIRPEGCSTCRCHGCSKEDVQLRQDKRPRESVERHEEIMRNGCCKECMKAFSSIGKACVCQVPAAVRKKRIPDSGCPVCGCKGCNPEDTGILKPPVPMNEGFIPLDIVKRNDHGHSHGHNHGHHMRTNDRRFDSRSLSRSRSRSRPRSRSRSFSGSRSRSRSPSGEQFELRYDNLDNSYIGGFLKNTFNLYLPLIGFGIPQRTYSYINGKPPSH